MRSFNINNEASIRFFLKEIYNHYQTPFDPTDDIRTLPGIDGNPFFTKYGGEYLENVMTQCFIYCILNDLNIYKIAGEIQTEIFKSKAAA